MSSGASLRADIREGREIIAEHQEIDAAVCSSAFALGVHPSARRVSCFFGVHHAAKTLLLAPGRELFSTLCRRWWSVALYLVIARSVIAFTKFRTKFLSSEEPVNQLTNFRFAGRGSMNDFLLLPKFSFPGFPI